MKECNEDNLMDNLCHFLASLLFFTLAQKSNKQTYKLALGYTLIILIQLPLFFLTLKKLVSKLNVLKKSKIFYFQEKNNKILFLEFLKGSHLNKWRGRVFNLTFLIDFLISNR